MEKKIKEIGIRSRKDIEKKLNKRVFLDLSVVFKNNKKILNLNNLEYGNN